MTSFADGTKLSMELTMLANGADFPVAKRGMYGPALTHGCKLVKDVAKDQPVTYGHVEWPRGRRCDKLRREQGERFEATVRPVEMSE